MNNTALKMRQSLLMANTWGFRLPSACPSLNSLTARIGEAGRGPISVSSSQNNALPSGFMELFRDQSSHQPSGMVCFSVFRDILVSAD